MTNRTCFFRRRLPLLLASCLGALAIGAAHAQASAPAGGGMGPGHGPGMAAPMPGGAASGAKGMDMHGAMMRGMQDMQQMKPTGDADRDFAMMMKMHHQQAVEMSQAYLQQGKSPELQKMARKIVSEQKKEIARFDRWLQSHK